MRLVMVGPGRAGGSLALAASAAGHRLVGVLARSNEFARRHLIHELSWESPLPEADLLVVSVRDDAIPEVAERLAGLSTSIPSAVHLSGFTSIKALAPLSQSGMTVGSFHPLQTLPNPETGSEALAGAWVAVTAEEPLRSVLHGFASDLSMHPIDLDDGSKPAYHAGASAASNFLVTALAIAHDLFASAGVPLAAVEALSRQVLTNAYGLGPAAALTGPIARGDLATVAGHLAAAERVSDSVGREFRLMAEATAIRAGTRLPEP
jgi:predicted short-subunit dehydrogenase-like oxidoreductase (DUF2520 family)